MLFGSAMLSMLAMSGVSHATNVSNNVTDYTIQVKDLQTGKTVNQTKVKESDGIKLSKSNLKGVIPAGYHFDDSKKMKTDDQKITLYVTGDSAETAEMPLMFVDNTGKTIGIGTVRGDIGTQIDISNSVPTGYKLVNASEHLLTIKANQTDPVKLQVIKATDADSDANKDMINDQVVKFVDDKGSVIGSGVVSGTKGSTVDITKIIPKGYQLADGVERKITLDGETKEVQVVELAQDSASESSKADSSSSSSSSDKNDDGNDDHFDLGLGNGTTATTGSDKYTPVSSSSHSSSDDANLNTDTNTSSTNDSGVDLGLGNGTTATTASDKLKADAPTSSSTKNNDSTSNSSDGSSAVANNDSNTDALGLGNGTTATTASDKLKADDSVNSSAKSDDTTSNSNSGTQNSGDAGLGLGNGTTATTGSAQDKKAGDPSKQNNNDHTGSDTKDVKPAGTTATTGSAQDGKAQEAQAGNGFAATGGSGKVSHNKLYDLIYIDLPQMIQHGLHTVMNWFN